MSKDERCEQIKRVLKIIADEAKVGDIIIVNRGKNMETRMRYDLSPKEFKDIVVKELQRLTIHDRPQGPEFDRDNPSDGLCVWKFKKKVASLGYETIYIKVKMKVNANGKMKALSFHIDNI